MIPLTQLFPHFTRLFSATRISRVLRTLIMTALWLSLGAIILISPIRERLSDVLGVSVEKKVEAPTNNLTLKKQITLWEEIIATRPDYRDGYYKLATLQYQLGNIEKSKKYLNEVIRIDPNYPNIIELEELLSSSPR